MSSASSVLPSDLVSVEVAAQQVGAPPSDLVDQAHVSGALSGACTGKGSQMANPRPTPKPGNLGPQTSLTRCTFPVLYPVLATERGPEWQTHARRRNLGRVLSDLRGSIPPVLSPWSIPTGELTPWPPQHRSKPTVAMPRRAPGRKPRGERPAQAQRHHTRHDRPHHHARPAPGRPQGTGRPDPAGHHGHEAPQSPRA